MITYFEKTLRSVAQEISYSFSVILFKRLFNVDIYRVLLILLLLLLLLNVIAFAIS